MRKKLKPDASPLARGIFARMLAAGLNQKSLAVESGLNETYVRDIFDGKSLEPSLAKLEKIAARLGCEVSDLRAGPFADSASSPAGERPKANSSPPGIYLSSGTEQDLERAALFKAWEDLDKDQRRTIALIIKDMVRANGRAVTHVDTLLKAENIT